MTVSKSVVAMTLAFFLGGCAENCIVDIRNDRITELYGQGEYRTWPILVSSNTVTTLWRSETNTYVMSQLSLDARVLWRKELPIFARGVFNKDIAFSADGSYVAYTKLCIGQSFFKLQIAKVDAPTENLLPPGLFDRFDCVYLEWASPDTLIVCEESVFKDERTISKLELKYMRKTELLRNQNCCLNLFSPRLSPSRRFLLVHDKPRKAQHYRVCVIDLNGCQESSYVDARDISEGILDAVWVSDTEVAFVANNTVYRQHLLDEKRTAVLSSSRENEIILFAVDAKNNLHYQLMTLYGGRSRHGNWRIHNLDTGLDRELCGYHAWDFMLTDPSRNVFVAPVY